MKASIGKFVLLVSIIFSLVAYGKIWEAQPEFKWAGPSNAETRLFCDGKLLATTQGYANTYKAPRGALKAGNHSCYIDAYNALGVRLGTSNVVTISIPLTSDAPTFFEVKK